MSGAESIDVLDESGQVASTVSRDEAEQDNHITANVLVFLFNSLGHVWIQLRSHTKNHYPNRWDISVCGGILSGETPEEAATRETREEAQIDTELHRVESFLNVFEGDNGEERKRLSYLFVGITDAVPVADGEEVSDFKGWAPPELRQDVEQHPFQYVPSMIMELDRAVQGYQKIMNGKLQ